jgi:hypothetical protein
LRGISRYDEFFRLIMHTLALSLIAWGCLFNSCAIAYLLLDKRTREANKKIFQKNIEEIDYHLHGREGLK